MRKLKEISKVQILEETYLYENHDEKELHIKFMKLNGYSIASANPFQTNDRVVTYQIRRAVDNIARL